jgi:uncharacterized membrane protein
MQMTDDRQVQTDIMQRNVSAIAEMQQKETSRRSFQDHVAAALTDFSGSMAFVYIHALWFAIWFTLNLGIFHIPGITGFDPYPFGLLTLIVSLEAIFLSTFVLIAQNNLSAVSDKRAELDLHINLLAEQKSAKILELLDKIGQEMDAVYDRFNYRPDAETQALKLSPEPNEVLEVIEGTMNSNSQELGVVREEVERVGDQVEQVATDVNKIKVEITGGLKPPARNDH